MKIKKKKKNFWKKTACDTDVNTSAMFMDWLTDYISA